MYVDIFSSLGVGVGVYAIFFLLDEWRYMRQMSAVRKTLGFVGGIGLIIHAGLAIVSLF